MTVLKAHAFAISQAGSRPCCVRSGRRPHRTQTMSGIAGRAATKKGASATKTRADPCEQIPVPFGNPHVRVTCASLVICLVVAFLVFLDISRLLVVPCFLFHVTSPVRVARPRRVPIILLTPRPCQLLLSRGRPVPLPLRIPRLHPRPRCRPRPR